DGTFALAFALNAGFSLYVSLAGCAGAGFTLGVGGSVGAFTLAFALTLGACAQLAGTGALAIAGAGAGTVGVFYRAVAFATPVAGTFTGHASVELTGAFARAFATEVGRGALALDRCFRFAGDLAGGRNFGFAASRAACRHLTG